MTFHFSPSSLGLLKECPRCFWLEHRLGVKRPNGPFPSLPGGMDAILKRHFEAYRAQGQMPPELKELGSEFRLYDDLKNLSTWQNNREGIRMEGDGFVLKGAVDNLLWHGSKIVVLDFKTRGWAPKPDTSGYYQDQMDCYNLLLRRNGHATEDYTYLLFYYPKGVLANGDVAFHTQLVKIDTSVDNARKLLESAMQIVKNDCPPASGACAFCQWQSHKDAGRTPPTPPAPPAVSAPVQAPAAPAPAPAVTEQKPADVPSLKERAARRWKPSQQTVLSL